MLKKGGEFRSAYDEYNRNPARLGIMGRRNLDSRLPGKERILGIRVGNAAMAFPLDAVRDARLAQAQVGGVPVCSLRRRTSGPCLRMRAGRALVT